MILCNLKEEKPPWGWEGELTIYIDFADIFLLAVLM